MISRALIRKVENLDLPLAALSALVQLRRDLDATETSVIAEARARGATWDEIAQALGITRQALHQRIRAREARTGARRTDERPR